MKLLTATGLLAAFCLVAWPLAAAAQDDDMPGAFNSLLVVETIWGGLETPEMIEMPLSHCNETGAALVLNPVCTGFLNWDGIEFWTTIEYTAEDDLGSWDAHYAISGLLSTENFTTMDGLEVPWLDEVSISADVVWLDDGGLTTTETWSYILFDVPPAWEPQGASYTGRFGEPPPDSLTYSLRLQGDQALSAQLGDFYNSMGMFDETDPELDFFDELWLEDVLAAEFDLVLFYPADINALETADV